ncbi:L-galactose dehydrogenase (L-GalDH) [Rhizodiscina lignyota]|uniref:L-galactose dehydrogenase (L-GalDH) n=1 Tax=Rhizodiscina lignyota TaxID=1504668 RepID=A0A9P4IC59_9PEZI|nr:L-galactose dehydrogenase (L-GalDH) [Rhizodiscina lignyota]
MAEKQPLSSVLPPLIFGCATFNIQYNKDPYALDTAGLVQEALQLGVRAFDTSPYYGPSEEILGAALDTPFIHEHFPREEYFILTKAGREASNEFNYSAEWIRESVKRSLKRLKTTYLDVVYCHDSEFVSPDEVLEAVRELRRIRNEEGTVKYVGVSGYPIEVLCSLAERVKSETGEPLDIVQSYANFNLQNTRLATEGVPRLRAAGVDVVPNASILDLGLLRRAGFAEGAAGDWHPAPSAMRKAIREASDFCDDHGELIEVIAIRFAIESWIDAGESVGSRGDPASGVPFQRESNERVGGRRLGVSVMGVSFASELKKTMQVWRSILDGLEDGAETAAKAGRWKKAHEWSLNRKSAVLLLAEGVRERLGEWVDWTWPSPPPDYTNERKKAIKAKTADGVALPTPEVTPEPSSLASSEKKDIPLR